MVDFLEYGFLISYVLLLLLIVYTYVRVNDLKEQRDYYKYLSTKMIGKGASK